MEKKTSEMKQSSPQNKVNSTGSSTASTLRQKRVEKKGSDHDAQGIYILFLLDAVAFLYGILLYCNKSLRTCFFFIDVSFLFESELA